MGYSDLVLQHYRAAWPDRAFELVTPPGLPRRLLELPSTFRVVVFEPGDGGDLWTYATIGMGQRDDRRRLEVHLVAPEDDLLLASVIASVAHFHHTDAELGLGHTVNLGDPWIEGSACDYALLSEPHLQDEWFRTLESGGSDLVTFAWLLPITPEERAYKIAHGLGALEQAFEDGQMAYWDPRRPSVV